MLSFFFKILKWVSTEITCLDVASNCRGEVDKQAGHRNYVDKKLM